MGWLLKLSRSKNIRSPFWALRIPDPYEVVPAALRIKLTMTQMNRREYNSRAHTNTWKFQSQAGRRRYVRHPEPRRREWECGISRERNAADRVIRRRAGVW